MGIRTGPPKPPLRPPARRKQTDMMITLEEVKQKEWSPFDVVPPISDTLPPSEFVHCKPLGIVSTVGELMDILKQYPRATGFGFRNQPMQELHELKYTDAVYVVFQ